VLSEAQGAIHTEREGIPSFGEILEDIGSERLQRVFLAPPSDVHMGWLRQWLYDAVVDLPHVYNAEKVVSSLLKSETARFLLVLIEDPGFLSDVVGATGPQTNLPL
jgi:hypothetical protein